MSGRSPDPTACRKAGDLYTPRMEHQPPPERPDLAIMGVGTMGGALLHGLLNSGWTPEEITLVESHPPRAEELRETTGCLTVSSPADGIVGRRAVVLAVKPQHIDPALEQLAGAVTPESLLIALVAGVRITRYEAALPGVPVIRAMPNTPALLGEGITGCAPGSLARTVHIRTARTVLAAVGEVVEVSEPLLDAVTALSGSGPAYAYRLAEAMAEAGERAGLNPETALLLATQTIKGAGAMMAASSEHPSELRRRVTSPQGVTEAALRVMEEGGFAELILQAVAAGTERSRQLGAETAPPNS